MRGFGRYAVLNQEHARARAQNPANQERKDASREVTDRRLERREREQPVRKVQQAQARPSVVETFDLRPSRPMTADAWSRFLPNGPAPGESEGGFIARRGVRFQQVREQRQAAAEKAVEVARVETGDTVGARRNKAIQAILDRRAAKANAQQSKDSPDKDRWLGAQVDD